MTVDLKEIKERVLPPLDDDLARAGSEFDTLAELRADIEARLLEQVQQELDARFRAAAVDELVRASNVVATGPLVEVRTQELLSGLVRSLQARGIDAATYLQVTGVTPEVLEERLRAEATQSVAVELVLDAVADKLEHHGRRRRDSQPSCRRPASPTRTSRSSWRRVGPTASATTCA